MNSADYFEKVNRLQTQISNDLTASSFTYPAQLAKAQKLLEEIVIYDTCLPEIRAVISTLKQTVKAFYSENQHRVQAQQFALNDIRKLAELCLTGKSSIEASHSQKACNLV
jgi:hypothetical protein